MTPTVTEVIATNGSASSLADQAVSSITGDGGTVSAESNLEKKADEVYADNEKVNPDNGKNPEDFYENTSNDSSKLSGELDGGELGNKNGKTDVKESLDAVGTALGKMQSAEKEANTSADNANEAAKNGNEIVTKVDGLVTEAETNGLSDDAFSAQEAVIEQAAQTLEGDCTKEDADAAVAAANQAVDQVNQMITDENNRISQIESQIKTLQGQYNGEKETYNTNVGLYNGAKSTFDGQKSVALSNAGDAKNELITLEGDAQTLITTTNNALDDYNNMIQGYIQIGGQELALKGMSKRELPDNRRLVYYIMKNYYVPDVLGGVMVFGDESTQMTEEQEFIAFNQAWNTDSGNNFKYTDENGKEVTSTKGDVLRLGEVKYYTIDENGNKKYDSILINYKTSNGNDLNSKDFTGLVIFAKTAHLTFDNKDVSSDILRALDETGTYYDEETGLTYTKTEAGEYLRSDGRRATKSGSIMYRNDNWYSGDTLLVEYDNNGEYTYTTDGKEGTDTSVKSNNQTNDFRLKISRCREVSVAYGTLGDAASTSKTKIGEAKNEVIKLETDIAKLECNRIIDTLKDLDWSLKNARANLAKLEAKRDEIIKKRDEIEKKRDDKFNTPSDNPTTPDTEPDDTVTDAPLIVSGATTVDAPADVTPVAAVAPAGAVLGANRPLETLGSVRSGSVLGERRGPQGAVLGKRRSPKTADGAMGGMVAGMMLSMMSAFGGAKVLKKKDEE